jgi:hypothetical protein
MDGFSRFDDFHQVGRDVTPQSACLCIYRCMHDIFPHASAALSGPCDGGWALPPHEPAQEMNGLTKPLAAEVIGTFALIFIGAGTGTALGGGDIPISPPHTV